MSTLNVLLPDNNVVAPRFDVDAFDRDRARSVAAQAAIAESRERVEQFEAERPDILADMQRRAQLALDEPITAPAAMPEEAAPAPASQYENALVEEIIERRIAEARENERQFLVAVMAEALAETVEVAHKRIDQLEHDLLQTRGLLHENALSIRSLLPDPLDDYAARTLHVLARAGSRTLTERAANRSYPSSDSVPWFGQAYFTDDA
jgi:hypothetical protein